MLIKVFFVGINISYTIKKEIILKSNLTIVL